ncbi:peptidase family C78-domain-containing protein, partial [Ochromonadaceae sp. CCMP2298]
MSSGQNWACPRCSFLNHPDLNCCELCEHSLASDAPVGLVAGAGASGGLTARSPLVVLDSPGPVTTEQHHPAARAQGVSSSSAPSSSSYGSASAFASASASTAFYGSRPEQRLGQGQEQRQGQGHGQGQRLEEVVACSGAVGEVLELIAAAHAQEAQQMREAEHARQRKGGGGKLGGRGQGRGSPAGKTPSKPAAKVPRYALCHPAPHHVSQKGAYGQGWSCGYRNIQMLCSSLLQLPLYRGALFEGSGVVPEIHQLQRHIELAWNAGFDGEGASHFGGRLVGSSEWIGTTECAVMLRYFGLRAVIVDFDGSVINAAGGKSSSGSGFGSGSSRYPPRPTEAQTGAGAGAEGDEYERDVEYVEIPGQGLVMIDNGYRRKKSRGAGAGGGWDGNGAGDRDGESRGLEYVSGAGEAGVGEGGGGGGEVPAVAVRLCAWVQGYYYQHEQRGLKEHSEHQQHLEHKHGMQCATPPPLPPLYVQHEGHSRTIVGVCSLPRSSGAAAGSAGAAGVGVGTIESAFGAAAAAAARAAAATAAGDAAVGATASGGGGAAAASTSGNGQDTGNVEDVGNVGAVGDVGDVGDVEALLLFDPSSNGVALKSNLLLGNKRWRC